MKKNKKDNANKVLPMSIVGCIVIAVALLIGYVLLCSFTDISPLESGIAVIVIYILASVAILTARFRRMRIDTDEKLAPALGNIMLDVVTKLHIPVLICDESGKIVWYNKTLSYASGRSESLYGTNISGLCSIPIEKIIEGTEGGGVPLTIKDSFFSAKSYKIKTTKKSYWIITLTDNTELKKLYARFDAEKTVVAYIVIDNLEELSRQLQEKYRSAESGIDTILKKWAKDCGGILKEYERDKYLMIFEARYLDEYVAHRFDILDAIRDTRIDDRGTPVTVSIGVARIDGTLEERERAARAALDMALQRGGDQVVLKSAEGVEFYGGRTKTVQKRTKVRARVVANELTSLISGADNVLIMGHRYADFDSIGAAVGIARLAMFCGVKANIVADLNDPNLTGAFDRLAALDDYKGLVIDRAAGLDMIRSNTLLIVVDVNNMEHFESPDIAKNVYKTVVIDHHRKTAEFKEEPAISYIEPSASSASELVAEILEQCLPAGNLLREEAELLFAGILLDTKQFTRNTSTRTFSSALYLRSAGANPIEAQALFKTALDDFLREAKFENNVVIYRTIIAIALSESDGSPSDRIAAAKAADKLLSINNVLAAFALVRINNTVHVSARSNGSVNVQLILEKFEGGGHYDVAGAQVEGMSMNDTLIMLKRAIDEYLDNN